MVIHDFYYFQKESNASIFRPNLSDIVILVFGAACQQGSPVELKGLLGRAVMLVLFLTVIFMYTSYTANIVALLQSSSTQIETFEDLLHSRMKFGVHDTVFNRYYFGTVTEPIRKAIYETKVAPRGEKPRSMSMEEGVKKIRKNETSKRRLKNVCLQSRENNLYYEERPKCSDLGPGSDGGSSFISVSMVDSYSALLVLTYGTIVALTVLALEIDPSIVD